MSQAQGGIEQVITFCKLLCDHTHTCANTHTHYRKKPLRFLAPEAFGWEKKKIQQCFIIGDRLLQVSHKRDKEGSAAKQLAYCLQRCRVISSVALKNKSRQTPIIISEGFSFLSSAHWFSLFKIIFLKFANFTHRNHGKCNQTFLLQLNVHEFMKMWLQTESASGRVQDACLV